MTKNAPENIASLSCEERYDYFLDEVAEQREVWILINNDKQFLKIFAEEYQIEYLPVWPSEHLASAYDNSAERLIPKSVSLPEFFKKWIPGLKRDGLEVGVIPGQDGTLWITEPEELANDLQDALSSQF